MNTVLSTKGQLVLPAPARRALGLQPGDKLRVTVEGRGAWLEPVRPPRGRKFEMKKNPRTGLSYISLPPDGPSIGPAEVKRLLADFP
jgi:AbrB family looped-hinge helix DNA binding protein